MNLPVPNYHPEFEVLCCVTVNGTDVGQAAISKDPRWKDVSITAKQVAKYIFGQHTEDVSVQITRIESGESRTYLVKGWFEHKQSARVVSRN